MAMCTMAMVMFTETTGNAVNVYAAADVTDSTIYAESDGVTDSTDIHSARRYDESSSIYSTPSSGNWCYFRCFFAKKIKFCAI